MISKNKNLLLLKLALGICFCILIGCMASQYQTREYELVCYDSYYECNRINSSSGTGRYYRSSGGFYPYRNYQNNYSSPTRSGHNPLYIPAGRFHNVGRPSKWKL
ncbi:hypothetical protein EHO58_15875 [Leptospira selangorensis]|uniref:hypothetical protein n=1 Tax=Leptospira selangorensis TaxID=2484982 RepID=UPI00108371F7|nr:hypothetical protein [Leptospira selangorensis]TGK02130.1 hypothetical protein EHO58_15875 [Leptospira selangorensis]